MRTKHSLKNMYIGVVSQIVLVLLGFISRKIFVDNLGIDYLGINGLLTNVLSLMALVESGIGISIVYNLYKPLADGDKKKVIALVQLYKKAYSFLALIVLAISICLYPFLGFLMKDGGNIEHLTFIYFLFVSKNMISYLNAHKWSLINADQRGYIITKINLIFQIITMVARIIILITTNSYVLYLVIELLLYLIQTIYSGRIVNNKYPYINTKEKFSIDLNTKENLVKNIKAMFLHNIGGFMVFGTDNILISSLISVGTVGLYSNYTMIIQQISALVAPVLGGIDASIGNLVATESTEKSYSIFKVYFLVSFWIYSFCVILLFNLLNPFISWWIGDVYILNNLSLFFILLNFYLTGMRTAIATFKNKAGLFTQDKYAPIFEGLINLITSLILFKYYGLAGIFMGTTVSTLLTVFWTQPVIVYKNVFKIPFTRYFIKYGTYSMIMVLVCMITTLACNNLISGGNFLSLIGRGLICLIIPFIFYFVLFYRSEEFKYILNIINSVLTKFRIRVMSVVSR
ncbi:lipopolysaccharide biosynthesis protein [Mesobacillus foraminis]|uniref:O-antigen/teichoic acid export membrane protein n=1 Tax=Mesobacillus foraminis TaxID=279826 RepID=A0A4R2B998_9BACI|nr:oligosaccharide flippase family protein [Mesobacillus foraminis]TCN22204.1 O-antigen/teichoic acid export membrane protein [Mesobacillus foraminis]